MGILTEIGAMRCVVVVLAVWWGCATGCPSLCSCRGAARPDGAAELAPPGEPVVPPGDPAPPGEPAPPPGEPLRLRCGGPPALISELKEIDFTDIAASVVSLNMSGNAISTLSRDLHLPNLQKLDLSRNQISLIESDAFYNVTSVTRLDLSHNRIAAVAREMFKGLASLERLYLDHNLLTALAAGTFHHLVALKQIDITENRLVCDCALVWLGEWLRGAAVRLQGSPRCAAPPALAGRAVRKLRALLDLAACGAPPPAALLTRPARDQLVFRGDALALVCSAPFASALHAYRLRWLPPASAGDVNVTASDVLQDGAAETAVFLPDVTERHAGDWTCAYADEGRGRHNLTVRVTVLSDDTRYCATSVSVDNKGLHSWPQALLNSTAAVPCRAGAGLATRQCGADGAWAAADTSACAYVSNVTKLLQQFALLDARLVRHAAVNATARLAALVRESTAPLALLDDPDDVMFAAAAVRNFMPYLDDEPELGSALLDVISALMDAPPAVLAQAEARHGACADLVRAAERLAPPHYNKQKSNLAVESVAVRAGFGGATCAWYSAGREPGPDPQPDAGAAPRLHCTTTNRTVARMLTFHDALIHASVQIPASLQFALAGAAAELVVAVFRDAALFPLLPEPDGGPDTTPDAGPAAGEHRARDYYGRSTKREDVGLEITSPVVSVSLRNGSVSSELIEPIIATLRAAGCGPAARCAVWQPAARRWRHNSSECSVLHVAGCTAVVALARPAAVALLARAERGYYGARTAGARFKVSHPAVYVGSLVLLGCLLAAAGTYAAAFPAVAMPRRAKHALVNTWLAQAALCLLYTLGIYQTEDVRLCRALGLLIHYLCLCCLVWMCASAHVLHAGARAARREPGERPVLGLYLCGWGGALIVCGISGAVNLRDYAGYAQCFLSTAAALAALSLPAAALLLLLAALLLLTRLALRRPAPLPLQPAEDAQHDAAVRLRAQAVVLALHLAACASGAVAVYRPLPAYLPHQEDICSILYAVCATVLGTFTLFFYGFARSDVRAQWALMHCYLRRSKRCCRNRSVFDSARRPPSGPARSRSGSRCSVRTDSKTNDSALYRAGAELNGQTLPKDGPKNTNEKSPNINLVVLHRQQYRSNNSVMTFPDTASVPAEAFYNPNQMNVAKKFFKKQRQNTKRNCLELPVRRDFDNDSHVSLPLPVREAYGGVAGIINAGSKVNNTNIHVERPAGGKERSGNNPNLLDEPAEHKSYCTDRAAPVVNIYTNVPETPAPAHHVLRGSGSQRCSLELSSASEPAPDTSELTAPSAAAETTDSDSFGQYVDCRRREPEPDKSLRDISEEGTLAGDDAGRPADELPRDADEPETGSASASEHGDESDIYCPNYQMSEVSIRSHGLYAPSPSSMGPPEISFSAEDVSAAESQYANCAAEWRRAGPAPGRGSAASSASELDELYTQITARRGGAAADLLDATAASDVTLRPGSASSASAPSAASGPGGTLRGLQALHGTLV